MVCKNIKLRPRSHLTRNLIGCFDTCEYYRKIKGIHITFLGITKKECTFKKICKYYESD